MKKETETSIPTKEILRDLEKAIISLDGLRRAYRGEIKFSQVSNQICDEFIKTRRAKYNITAKSWGKRAGKK
jgi:hypothetical protein